MQKEVYQIIHERAEDIAEALIVARNCLVRCYAIINMELALHPEGKSIEAAIDKIDRVIGHKKPYLEI